MNVSIHQKSNRESEITSGKDSAFQTFILLEGKKLKRTGFFPLFILGSLLAAAFPLINMAARSETYTGLPGNPVTILFQGNWQMMAMLNLLIVICGTCIMYHTEYADNGLQKMEQLPLRIGNLFLGKFIITVLCSMIAILVETAVIGFCAYYWFAGYEPDLTALLQNTGFAIVLMLPTIMLMLVIASVCKNMWISLGIGIILVFTLSILPPDILVLNLCPFSTPYQLLDTVLGNDQLAVFLSVCTIETVFFGIAELIYFKIRRYFS